MLCSIDIKGKNVILKTCVETKLAVGYTDNGHRDLIDGEKYDIYNF